MKCSLGISNFLEEISSLSHSVPFLYFFALIAEEGLFISPCYSLELCIQILISFLFASLLFTAICKASSDNHFAFLHFIFWVTVDSVMFLISASMFSLVVYRNIVDFYISTQIIIFSAIHKVSSDNHFAFLDFFFLEMVLITASCTMSGTSVHSSSGTLSDLTPWIYLSLTVYDCKGFDLGLPCMV